MGEGTPPASQLEAGRNTVRLMRDARVKCNALALLLSASIQLLATKPAQAQEAAPAAQSGGLEEIVITAEKRTAGLQSTPIAVNAVAGDALTQQGVNSLVTIDKLVPAMVIERTVAGMEVDIRGVEAVDTNPTSESPNAVYVDGAVIAHPTGYDGILFDIARVEVLKGPQGTLYGRNSNGGAVNIITNRPANEFSAQGTVEYGSYDLISASGALNLPLTDTLAARVAFQSYSHDGYLKSGLDDADQRAARLELLWRPDDRQSLLITGDMEKIGGKGSGAGNVTGFVPLPGSTGPAAYIPSDPRDDRHYDGPNATLYHYDSRNFGVMAQYDYSFDFATWTTQVAHREFESNPNTQFLPLGTWVNVPATFKSYSFESRLTSANSRQLDWIVGAYGFLNRDTGTLNLFTTPDYSPAAVPLLILGNPSERTDSWAIFGQSTYTPDWLDNRAHLTLGGRYSADHKVADVFTTYPAFGFNLSGHYADSWDAFTNKVTFGYDVLPNSLVYVTRATGYEAGGFAYGTTPEFKPEYITDYEFGAKNRFFSNRLQVNLEGFYYKYKNFESSVAPVVNGFPSPTVANAGTATYKGLSAEIQVLPTDADMLKFSVARYYARYGEFDVSALYPSVPSFTNQHIPDVPNWTGNFSYDHTWQLAAGSLDAQAFVRFRGYQLMSQAFTNTPNALYITDSPWAMLDLSLRYEAPASKWSVSGYVRNVTNALRPITERYDTSSGMIVSNFYPPRTIGVIVSAKVH